MYPYTTKHVFPRARATNTKSRSSVCNRLWRHQQNVNRASETHIWCVGIGFLIFISWFIMSCKRWNNVCTLVKMCLFANSSVIRQWCAHGVISRYICACDSLSERETFTACRWLQFIPNFSIITGTQLLWMCMYMMPSVSLHLMHTHPPITQMNWSGVSTYATTNDDALVRFSIIIYVSNESNPWNQVQFCLSNLSVYVIIKYICPKKQKNL